MAMSLLLLRIFAQGTAVVGESTTNGYERQIELDSFEWSVTAKHTANDSGDVHTEVRPKSVTLAKTFDRSTARLCQLMRSRNAYTTARITMLSAALAGTNERSLKIMELLLTDGYIEDVGLQASESGKAMALKEKVTLSFRKCQVMYYPPDPTRPVRGAAMTFDLEQPSVKA